MNEPFYAGDYALRTNGLTADILEKLSYESSLDISLKKNLHYFEKTELLTELFRMAHWLNEQTILDNIASDYRIKSRDSINLKYARYYPDRQVRKVFNDILSFRALCDSYSDISFGGSSAFRVADLSHGKANDDGYRGVHVYYQLSAKHYPIEIQFNTFDDRQMNNWLHDYLYKKEYPVAIGNIMRRKYELGLIKTAPEFEEVLKDVLSHCER